MEEFPVGRKFASLVLLAWFLHLGTSPVLAQTGPRPPSAVSVTPSSGSGTSQTFSLLFSDPEGAADLSLVLLLLNGIASPGHINGCFPAHLPGTGQVWLLNDAGDSWLGPAMIGASSLLQNSQCVVNLQDSSVSSSGTDMMLSLALSFRASFAGTKLILLYAADAAGLTSGWQPRGNWSIPGSPPAAISVSPSSGIGTFGSFSLLFSDPDGVTDLYSLIVIINDLNGPGHVSGCVPAYLPGTNQLWMLNDAGNGWLGPATLGTVGTLSNSQCTVILESSWTATSGTNMALKLALNFRTSSEFPAGNKLILMYADDRAGLTSDWQFRGTWYVVPIIPPP